jgi:hypothetical protein
MERVSWVIVSNLSSYDQATPSGSFVTASASISSMNPTLASGSSSVEHFLRGSLDG